MLYRSEMIEIITYPSALRRPMMFLRVVRASRNRLSVVGCQLTARPCARQSTTANRQQRMTAAHRAAVIPLLALVDDFGFDDVVLVRALARRRRRRSAGSGVRARVLVHHFREFVRGLGQVLGGLLEVVEPTLLHGLA